MKHEATLVQWYARYPSKQTCFCQLIVIGSGELIVLVLGVVIRRPRVNTLLLPSEAFGIAGFGDTCKNFSSYFTHNDEKLLGGNPIFLSTHISKSNSHLRLRQITRSFHPHSIIEMKDLETSRNRFAMDSRHNFIKRIPDNQIKSVKRAALTVNFPSVFEVDSMSLERFEMGTVSFIVLTMNETVDP
jgi:hypothetical protein